MQFSTVPRLPLVKQIKLVTVQLLGAHLLGGTAKVLGKLLHRPDVTADRVGRVVAPPEIVQHALTEWGHRILLPMTHQASAIAPSLATPPLSIRRASGLVLTGYSECMVRRLVA